MAGIGIGGGLGVSAGYKPVLVDWWDEEERKRREGLGIAGAPLPPQSAGGGNQGYSFAPLGEKQRSTISAIAERSRWASETRYRTPDGQPMDPIAEYFKLEREVGPDNLAKRLANVTSIWKSYMPTVSGKDGIWELVKSSYTLEEIEEMCRQAGNVAYGVDGGVAAKAVRDEATRKALQESQLNPNDPYSRVWTWLPPAKQPSGRRSVLADIGGKAADFLGLARNEDGTVNWGWTGVGGAAARFWEHPNEVAAAAGAAALIVGTGGAAAPTMLGVLQGGTATGAAIAGTGGAAGIIGAAAASTPGRLVAGASLIKGTSDVIGGIEQQYGADITAFRAAEAAVMASQEEASVYITRVTNEVLGVMPKLEAKDAKSVQESLQAGVKDEYGNVVTPGFGTDLPANGAWTEEWDDAMRKAIQEEIGGNIQTQRQWIEAGYAESYYTVDGDMDTPQWQHAKALAYENELAIAERMEKDPLGYAQLSSAGLPITDAGWEALFNRLKAEGVAQAPLKVMLTIVGMVGGAYNSLWSTLNHVARRENDAIYQSIRSELNDYIKSRTDIYSEMEIATLANRYAFADDELVNGKLKDDPKAQEYAARLKERTAQIITAGFEPSTIGIVGNVLGFSPESVETFKENNAELDLGLNLLRDVVVAAKTGTKIRELKRGKPVPATVEAFKGSNTAYLRVQEMVKDIKAKKEGLAQDAVRGSDSAGLVRTLSDAYHGKNVKSGFFRNLADEVAADAAKGDTAAVAAKLERGGVVADQAQTAASDLVSKWDAAKTVEQNAKAASSSLAKEQRTTKSLLDFERTAMDHAASAYAELGQSVFPYLRAPQLPGGQLNAPAHRAWLRMVDGIENPYLKRFLGQVGKRFERGPVDSQEYAAQGGAARVFEAAYAASDGNVSFALKMRSRWTMARSDVGFDRVAETISKEANRTHAIRHGNEQRQVQLSVDPRTGQSVRDTLADTGQAQYKAMFRDARATMWAPKNIVEGMSGFEQAWTKVLTNPWRKVGRGLKKINDPMRRYTVGFPLLFTKHAITDSTRTLIEEGPGAFFDAFRGAKAFDDVLAELSPDVANSVRANLHKSKMSEQHYDIGSEGIDFHWRSAQIYELTADGTFRTKNMGEGVEALRRIAIGKAYQKYAEGGMEGVLDWLLTPEGKRFLYKSGNVGATKAFLEAMEPGRKITGKELYDTAAVDYLDRFGSGYFEALDLTAPKIAAGLKEMALNKTPLTQANIESLVRKVNAAGVVENPYLSVPKEPNSPAFAKFLKDPAYRTAQFMRPNKWNRQVLYKHSFKRYYNDLKKQGLNPDNAAKVAMDLAELETARVHFDLANGLYFEAQNRWYAWFGTKHRLYNSYLLKMATERPAIAGAAMTLMDYLEDKNNEDPSASEFDKHTISIPIGWMPGRNPGDVWRFNPATIAWLSEYPLESTVATSIKIAGASIVNVAANKTVISQDFGDFGFQSGRWDGVILSVGTAVAATVASRTSPDGDWLEDIFNSRWMPERTKKRLAKGMTLVQFEAAGRGERVEPQEAFWKAMASSLIYEGIQLGKPISGSFRPQAEGEMTALMKEYDTIPPEERPQWLNDNPKASLAFGIYTTNPVVKMVIDEGWEMVGLAAERKRAAYEQALDDGTIFDSKVVKQIENEYDTAVNRLIDPDWRDPETGEPAPEYNEKFAQAWGQSGYEDWTREEGIKFLWSLSDADAKKVAQSGYVPDQAQQEKQAAAYTEAYEQRIGELGWDTLPVDSPARFWLKQDMVTDPMRAYTKNAAVGDVPWASRREETIARNLARGENGPTKAAAYLNEVYLRSTMEAYGAGTSSVAKSGVDTSTPLFSKMTTEEKAEIGWNSDKSAEYVWRRWAMMKAAQQVWMRDNGVSSSSTQAKEIAAALEGWAQEQAGSNTAFAREYEFAHKPLHERLREIGIGTTGKASDAGWTEFFGIVSAYHKELAETTNPSNKKVPGVGPSSQAAAPVARYYLQQLMSLKDREKEWWQEFSQMYTPSKFGFYWHLEDGSDKELWRGEEQAAQPTEYGVI